MQPVRFQTAREHKFLKFFICRFIYHHCLHLAQTYMMELILIPTLYIINWLTSEWSLVNG